MMRHNRALLRVYQEQGRLTANLAHRHVLPHAPHPIHAAGAGGLRGPGILLPGVGPAVAAANDQHGAGLRTGFYLSFLQRRFASSLHAIGETLRRRRERVKWTLEHLLDEPGASSAAVVDCPLDEDMEQEEGDAEVIEQLLKNRSEADFRWELDNAERDAGGQPVRRRAARRPRPRPCWAMWNSDGTPRGPAGSRQTVIFTQFWDTLEDHRPALAAGRCPAVGGHLFRPRGANTPIRRPGADRHRARRDQAPLPAGSDRYPGLHRCGGRGPEPSDGRLSGQFRLPWNPAKVEQRIGRIDRIGQLHEHIYVQNLCYLGSVEEIVYGRLLTGWAACAVVGDQQVSMSAGHGEA